MTTQILLALLASACTASASVAQRIAAAPAPVELRFSWRLVAYLMHRPVWFLGILLMIAGFACQLAALHFGDLALVEPVIATELLFVWGYLALRSRGQVRTRDWVAAVGMAASLGGFLYLAEPRGGVAVVPTTSPWVVAGMAIAAATACAIALSGARRSDGGPPSPARQAALLSIAAGVTWGFVAAITKQLAGQIGNGPAAVFMTWTPYLLLTVGAAGMFIVSNAFQAGPLAASQPGLTVVEPLVASLLGVTLFGEHVRHGPGALAGELALVVVLSASVVLLSHSPLIGVGSRPVSDAASLAAADAPSKGTDRPVRPIR